MEDEGFYWCLSAEEIDGELAKSQGQIRELERRLASAVFRRPGDRAFLVRLLGELNRSFERGTSKWEKEDEWIEYVARGFDQIYGKVMSDGGEGGTPQDGSAGG